MSKLLQLQSLKGKEKISFLKANKQALITEKKSMIKHSDPIRVSPELITDFKAHKQALKSIGVLKDDDGDDDMDETMLPDSDSVRVKVVANTANWCDQAMDVLLDDCWKKSIKQRQGLVPHLADHTHKISAKIGEVVRFYSQKVSLKDLGLDMDGTTQCLIFETDVYKSYDEKVYNQYKIRKVNQHSIGLQYLNLSLAINDEDSEKEFDFWSKYLPVVINQDVVKEEGYFWVVSEIKLLENSSVLFGCNELTPTLNVESSTDAPPPTGTGKSSQGFDLMKAIKSMVMCPNCVTVFNNQSETGNKCPSCGQYVSPSSNQAESPTFDLLAAISQTKFV